ncbi:MAG: hypothetical protein KME06_08295 [Kastovskya adunca ATA6-11-RM4]|nr:hypothetical protein [Kastovskya adunca ATA6-11-RM4]
MYRQLQDWHQWVQPKDQRHLQGFAEILSAILQSKSAWGIIIIRLRRVPLTVNEML